MGAFDFKSKTVRMAIAALVVAAGKFIEVGQFDIMSFLNLFEASVLPLLAVFVRHTVTKNS